MIIPARTPLKVCVDQVFEWHTIDVVIERQSGIVSALVAEVLHLVGLAGCDDHVSLTDHGLWGGIREVLSGPAFLSVELSFIAVFASAYGISATLRLASEESASRADLVLITPVSRIRWAASHLVVAVAGAGLLMLACGLALGVVQVAQTGDPGMFGANLLAAVVRLPAVWVLVGVTVALYGLARRAAPVAWVVLVATFLASEIGPLLDLPRWVRDFSPFTHVPPLPGGEVTAGPLLALLAVSAALITAGLWALRRRDVDVS